MERGVLKHVSRGDFEENWQREVIWSIYVAGGNIDQVVTK
jgi:hypothetical protein